MAGLNSEIDKILKKMHGSQTKERGTYGEQAVFKICEEFYQSKGGILIHSYSYKVDEQQLGNIKKSEDGLLYVENLGSSTEIDVLYISKFRVFPIEVKAYHANKITISDAGIDGCFKTDKSPVHQNEMHCRHLYAHIFRGLPDGQTAYIVPIVCMVEDAEIIDARCDWQREYIKLTILDTLYETIQQFDTPLQYQLNLTLMDSILKECMISSEKYLPPRL